MYKPKFPLEIGPLVIPNSTWAAVLGDQIASLKLGFDIKRKHDPKGFLDAHFKENHIKGGYVHEEVPGDSIYQGVNAFLRSCPGLRANMNKVTLYNINMH